MTLTGCLWSTVWYLRRVSASWTATLPVSPVRTVMADRHFRVSPRRCLRNYLTISGTVSEPTPSKTIIAAPTTTRRTRSLVKYGTRSSGIDGSADSTMKRPPRPLRISLRAPSDISTARTVAWSPPTRAWDTLREAVAVWAPEPGAPMLVRGPGGRIGWRNLPLARFLPLRLIDLQV